MYKLCVVLILVVEMVALALLSLVAPDTLVLLIAPVIMLTVVLAFALYPRFSGVSFRAWRLTPERITSQKQRDSREDTDPIRLSRSIVERAVAIQRAMLDSPSEVQIEIYALGYRACVNDMITLTHLANEELPSAGFPRRVRLNRARRRATEALSSARSALPPGALRPRHQETQ